MMDKLFEKVTLLAQKEYNEAAKNHGRTFRSMHEGFAVLMEEVAETSEDMIRLEDDAMQELWCAIREDDAERANKTASVIELYAKHLACEAIQVAAMARKMQKTMGVKLGRKKRSEAHGKQQTDTVPKGTGLHGTVRRDYSI